MTEYWLQIVFKSNERPWRTDRYDPYPRNTFGNDDEKAKLWAADMQEGLLEYQVTLYKDGKVLEYGENELGRIRRRR